MDGATDFYFDAVSQVHMPRWSDGRVVLVGDACQCVSLISGQGSALAMAGAYVLAGELKSAADRHETAFQRFADVMMPEIARKQRKAIGFAGSFIPRSKFGIWVRDTFVGLMFVPFVSKRLIKRLLSDRLKLQEY